MKVRRWPAGRAKKLEEGGFVAGHPFRDFARASRINQTYTRSGNATELLTLLANERSAAPAQSIGQRFRPPRSLVSVCAQDDVDAMACGRASTRS